MHLRKESNRLSLTILMRTLILKKDAFTRNVLYIISHLFPILWRAAARITHRQLQAVCRRNGVGTTFQETRAGIMASFTCCTGRQDFSDYSVSMICNFIPGKWLVIIRRFVIMVLAISYYKMPVFPADFVRNIFFCDISFLIGLFFCT